MKWIKEPVIGEGLKAFKVHSDTRLYKTPSLSYSHSVSHFDLLTNG